MQVTLHPAMEKFVDEQIRSGRYSTPEDVINGALSILDAQSNLSVSDPSKLRADLQHGLEQADRGEVGDWDIEELRADGQRLLAEDRRRAV